MEKKTRKKQAKKQKKNDFFKTLKPILIFSFLINIILLSYIYFLKVSSHIYIFSGDNEYINVDSGVLSLSHDVNLLEGNSINYIGKKDFKIKEIKIGYYILENDNLKEIIKHYEKFEESTSINLAIKSITSLNVSESAKDNKIFNINSTNLESKLYVVLEAKLDSGETLASKMQLDVSKIK